MKDKNYELLISVYKNADMGEYSTGDLIDKLKGKDNKITDLIIDINKKYINFKKKSLKKLNDYHIDKEENGIMSKMMSSMGVSKEVLADNSDSAIADMMIQGILMGITEIEKFLNDDNEYIEKKLGKDFYKFQQSSLIELKKYL